MINEKDLWQFKIATGLLADMEVCIINFAVLSKKPPKTIVFGGFFLAKNSKVKMGCVEIKWLFGVLKMEFLENSIFDFDPHFSVLAHIRTTRR